MDSLSMLQKLTISMKKYRHALLILLLGLMLMLLPTGRSSDHQSEPEPTITASDIQSGLEDRLEAILRQIQGAGEVQVLLTERTGSETRYQSDTESDDGDNTTSVREQTVIVEDSSNAESALIRRIDPPEYLGAVVVCQGGDNPTVKLAIVEAVRCATGLGADQISVIKMK